MKWEEYPPVRTVDEKANGTQGSVPDPTSTVVDYSTELDGVPDTTPNRLYRYVSRGP